MRAPRPYREFEVHEEQRKPAAAEARRGFVALEHHGVHLSLHDGLGLDGHAERAKEHGGRERRGETRGGIHGLAYVSASCRVLPRRGKTAWFVEVNVPL